jgi:DNA-directed RNA polymerase specialized sigma24 family protein
LFGIARHQRQQTYRNRARCQAIVVTFADEIRARTQAQTPSTSGDNLGHEQRLAQLEASLAKLPREERLLVILRY